MVTFWYFNSSVNTSSPLGLPQAKNRSYFGGLTPFMHITATPINIAVMINISRMQSLSQGMPGCADTMIIVIIDDSALIVRK
jgi:hypothetical protein